MPAQPHGRMQCPGHPATVDEPAQNPLALTAHNVPFPARVMDSLAGAGRCEAQLWCQAVIMCVIICDVRTSVHELCDCSQHVSGAAGHLQPHPDVHLMQQPCRC